ncbi:MAG TPA: hypothetical protein VLV49_14820 [Terriglobales bacterium]|nr:hypothetical protein [Terriglobales bacterium]
MWTIEAQWLVAVAVMLFAGVALIRWRFGHPTDDPKRGLEGKSEGKAEDEPEGFSQRWRMHPGAPAAQSPGSKR